MIEWSLYLLMHKFQFLETQLIYMKLLLCGAMLSSLTYLVRAFSKETFFKSSIKEFKTFLLEAYVTKAALGAAFVF